MSTFTIKAEKHIEHPTYDDTIPMKLDIQETLGKRLKINFDRIGDWYCLIVSNVKQGDLEILRSLFNDRMYYVISEEEIGTVAEFIRQTEKKQKYSLWKNSEDNKLKSLFKPKKSIFDQF